MELKGKINLFEDKAFKLPTSLYGEIGLNPNPCAEISSAFKFSAIQLPENVSFVDFARAFSEASNRVNRSLSEEELNLLTRALSSKRGGIVGVSSRTFINPDEANDLIKSFEYKEEDYDGQTE